MDNMSYKFRRIKNIKFKPANNYVNRKIKRDLKDIKGVALVMSLMIVVKDMKQFV